MTHSKYSTFLSFLIITPAYDSNFTLQNGSAYCKPACIYSYNQMLSIFCHFIDLSWVLLLTF